MCVFLVLVLLQLKGIGLWNALDDMLSKFPIPSGSYPHVSNTLRVVFDGHDTCSTPNKRVRSITINGKALDLNATYKIATTTFLAKGGDGITGFHDYGQIISTDEFKVADVALKYFRKLHVLPPVPIIRVRPQN